MPRRFPGACAHLSPRFVLLRHSASLLHQSRHLFQRWVRAQRSFPSNKITQAEQMIEAYKRGIGSKRTLPQESVKALIDIYRKNVVDKVSNWS
jgi:hypothetical protein